jgi:hypothetical protein
MNEFGSYRIGGQEAMTRKTLRQAVKSLAHALDDPRFDDWDDPMILTVLGQIIDRHRQQRDSEVFVNLSGAQVMSEEQINKFVTIFGEHLRRQGDTHD